MQGDFIQKEDTRPISGYGSALLVDEHNDGYYELVIPLETIPTIYGDEDVFDYDLLTAIAKGKVKGKMDLSAVTTDILYTRENIYRLSQLENKTLSYMVFHNNYTGYTFTGQISFRENDTEADILRGTLSITPLNVNDRFMDGRNMVRQTLDFAGTIPESVVLTSGETSKEIGIAVSQADANATFDVEVKGASDKFTATYADGKLTISTTATETAYGLIFITAKSATKMGDVDKYAPWTMTIAVEYKA